MGQRHRRLVAASCCIWPLTVVALVSCQNAPDVAGLRSLATEGDAAAQFDLGFMYRNGEGVPQDNGEALRWYRLALFLSRCWHRICPCPRSYSSAHFESFSLLRFNPATGSSPRLRGTAQFFDQTLPCERVYPRACGEQVLGMTAETRADVIAVLDQFF